jgi:hypothetical protein
VLFMLHSKLTKPEGMSKVSSPQFAIFLNRNPCTAMSKDLELDDARTW